MGRQVFQVSARAVPGFSGASTAHLFRERGVRPSGPLRAPDSPLDVGQLVALPMRIVGIERREVNSLLRLLGYSSGVPEGTLRADVPCSGPDLSSAEASGAADRVETERCIEIAEGNTWAPLLRAQMHRQLAMAFYVGGRPSGWDSPAFAAMLRGTMGLRDEVWPTCPSVRALGPGTVATCGDATMGPCHRRALVMLGGACSMFVSARATPPYSRHAWFAGGVVEECCTPPSRTRRCECRDTSESRPSHARQAKLG